ncbi:histidine kinase [Janthinobacterium fluminis]|uniref:Histidine kinase n=1 Tax=Janthinobacterium fluminis TaxID=2987524 RepID=A0ABT5JV23_9BURK|nr:histidine kinase [Janthinobacterium fluminis]MDC8756419.1 histidine kinase [Janthinobacterium fluminis]
MITSVLFIFRIAAAWFLAYLFIAVTLASIMLSDGSRKGNIFVFIGFMLVGAAIVSAFSHLRRVRLVAGVVNNSTLSNRQRRQIEIPYEAGEGFDMIDAAIRELPGSIAIESARDSLQVRARVKRMAPYSGGGLDSLRILQWFDLRPNQILATVVPNGDAGSVTLICEPGRAAWCDLFLVDDGSNLENAEAIGRAITRRVAQRRRGEQAEARQSAVEKELTMARLNLLHAQVEPHFLYNTLASAQILTRSDPARADAMLGNLILYLRHAVPRADDAPSTIGAELERTRAYLDIMKIRMGARLSLHIEVAPELLGQAFPGMMLQTLAENAIKHGLEPKPGGGAIWISVRAIGGAMAVTVADDGRGFSQDGGGTGIGLRNVRERLQLLYGATASFSIIANFPGGVAATITVPAAALATTTLIGSEHV